MSGQLGGNEPIKSWIKRYCVAKKCSRSAVCAAKNPLLVWTTLKYDKTLCRLCRVYIKSTEICCIITSWWKNDAQICLKWKTLNKYKKHLCVFTALSKMDNNDKYSFFVYFITFLPTRNPGSTCFLSSLNIFFNIFNFSAYMTAV